jgi:hypothetical protein
MIPSMKRHTLVASLAAIALILCVPSLVEGKRLLSDYTLRLHIYGSNWMHNSMGYHGFGRANLFDEQGVPHGVEFTYDCDDHLMGSSGNEAYPARWKKPGREVEVIFGEIGAKSDQFQACDFKIALKTYVFYSHAHDITTETAQDFMANHKSQTPTVGAPTADDIPVSANPHP